MYWILAALILLATFLVPRFRPIGAVGCVILLGLLAWGVVQRWSAEPPDVRPQRGAPSSPAITQAVIPPEAIELEGLKLTGSGAPFELRGTLVNRSDLRLRTVTLQLMRRDCYEGALDPTGCVPAWQHRQWLSITVPPHQSRPFALSVWSHHAVPRIRGEVKDEFAVVSATGEPVPEFDAEIDAGSASDEAQ